MRYGQFDHSTTSLRYNVNQQILAMNKWQQTHFRWEDRLAAALANHFRQVRRHSPRRDNRG